VDNLEQNYPSWLWYVHQPLFICLLQNLLNLYGYAQEEPMDAEYNMPKKKTKKYS
jgi:hypothetical protein